MPDIVLALPDDMMAAWVLIYLGATLGPEWDVAKERLRQASLMKGEHLLPPRPRSDSMLVAIAETMNMVGLLHEDQIYGRLARVAQKLVEEGFSIRDVRNAQDAWRNDWRSNGTNPDQFREFLHQWREGAKDERMNRIWRTQTSQTVP